MGYFDNNIHMNGSGTTYQAFLNLAEAAEEKGGRIGDRTVRLVKSGDGLDKKQVDAILNGARNWMLVTGCAMQLQQAIG